MAWTLRFSSDFERSLHKLDRQTARRILVKLHGLVSLDEPQARCKGLAGPLAGLWRLRVGDYRVLLDIRRAELVIVALGVGHRSSIYDT
ncbi:type II toxin-antitoxin system RelE family toxin [Propionibacterium australiense]|uniref:ParE toxin of type II toxin-antitoxin system, parDE n=1 Tax=Propionibacterium australiense TaxID=119981 RepID=A0A383SA55_9ACTN|nr:type II toxin-antitoxin system RelE/ParE family toxin [Propionibacterium australiense]RLP06667.1 type II toxin-antitoxin system RelE/ParE family toxin [Propionibacterium australiense]RLP06694.1 type II toxin-antitoxin system RelE/ParE family toxin [Propionibacterium australiense]SYZ34294.1 ParE toxin of type II toxin-antitoxin system, parDE [Propionibacterium australiense]VEH92169.1 Toxin RelG [Propionibacterium australiense]